MYCPEQQGCRAFSLALALWWIGALQAQEPAAGPGADPEASRAVAATVDGQPVRVSEVEREAVQALGGRPTTPDAMKVLRARALQRLIDRQLVIRQLERQQLGAASRDVDSAVQRLQKRLQREGPNSPALSRIAGMDETELRRDTAWRLNWERCLEHYLTDENLEKYFDSHRRDFDGAQLRLSHILFKTQSPRTDPSLQQALQRARQLRDRIVQGELAFDEAARKFSDAPTKDDGGRLGWIARHEPMPETFSQAAFALEVGQISQPVVSPFGVHLIQCQEIKPGEKRWTDVRKELEAAAAEHLFQWLADRGRPGVEIQFTGRCPYFKPGGKELIEKDSHAEP
jgi:parvulin-like peptidyl-prolyl isomerase